ncbi:flagellar motor switch protein FliM [Rariglobus hedericola]|uniref:Flagellar motor switch protein FliM n=1 Tax=Rariglobus hedericola TaxID=2597822 RepID=A0A556QPU3_9BACT|nr:flagellar motor switch protein FliM [Rariglobus hedericola]TSJ78649.1 flagellar motor switch protein FliM [Rariglobus hedericola]
MSDDNDLSSILDQSEIDRLLSQAVEPAKPLIYRADGRRDANAAAPKVEAYDFRNPVFLTEVDLRRLRLIHEDFIRYLSARLALFLRMECTMKMSKLTTLTYAKFTEGLPNPTHLCLFKVEPLQGVGILDINPRLALTLVDRMLGGRGHSVKVDRYLTEIEIALLEDILRIVLEEWCGQWHHDTDLHPEIIGHENNGRFLQTSPKDAIMLALTIEFDFGDCAEPIQIGVPYYTIEPMVKSIQAKRNRDSSPAQTRATAEWKDVYAHIALPTHAEWDAFDLSLRELTQLRVGDVLELPVDIVDKTRICLAGVPKFNGTVGLDDDKVVVKISEKLKTEETSHAHAH